MLAALGHLPRTARRLTTTSLTALALSATLVACTSDGGGADDPAASSAGSSDGTGSSDGSGGSGGSGGAGEGTSAAASAGSPGTVLHSGSGVQRVLADGTRADVSQTGAADAYGVGSLVVLQDAGQGRFGVDGPVRVWDDGETSDLADTDGSRLLDAGFVDGQAVAVLVRLDGEDAGQVVAQPLDGGEASPLTTVPSGDGEQVIAAARLVSADGGLAQLREDGDRPVFFVERFDGPAEAVWRVRAGSVSLTEMAADDEQVAIIQPAFDGRPGAGNAPLLQVTQLAPDSGQVQNENIVSLDLPTGDQPKRVPRCYGFSSFYVLTCAIPGRSPVDIRVPDGGVSPVVEGVKLPAGAVPAPIRLLDQG